jgi:protoporphyrinogen oxidase
MKISIIGEGISGLACAKSLITHLLSQDHTITIYEASNDFGGRIKPLKNFADFDIELGMEETRRSKHLLPSSIDSNKKILIIGQTINSIYLITTNSTHQIIYPTNRKLKQIIDLCNDDSYNRVGDYQDISLKD